MAVLTRERLTINNNVIAIADKAVISLEYFSITRLTKVNNTRLIAKNISQVILLIKYKNSLCKLILLKMNKHNLYRMKTDI